MKVVEDLKRDIQTDRSIEDADDAAPGGCIAHEWKEMCRQARRVIGMWLLQESVADGAQIARKAAALLRAKQLRSHRMKKLEELKDSKAEIATLIADIVECQQSLAERQAQGHGLKREQSRLRGFEQKLGWARRRVEKLG